MLLTFPEVGGSGNFKVDESWGIRAGPGQLERGPSHGAEGQTVEKNLFAQRTGSGEG